MMMPRMIKPINRKAIGYRIASLRASDDWSQEEFVNIFKANKSIVNKWERGIHLPSMDRLRQMEQIFNITLKWLLYGEGEKDGRSILDKT
ncbi:helix-turn-helix domain-containing protein [Staphylococcus equorum]|uniref:helix-turn-helix domain-containing protein n=1 Tax=Staphylococcus equorum TaxID=246432 RepID=UPI00203F9425|nr:helix-turn-helix transcriptional regulator [Staphylococcus equorum]MCM3071704.1 helix-turn-helix domain-containing protein [Staphylococcus equorum]